MYRFYVSRSYRYSAKIITGKVQFQASTLHETNIRYVFKESCRVNYNYRWASCVQLKLFFHLPKNPYYLEIWVLLSYPSCILAPLVR